jgi:hypothetical protein
MRGRARRFGNASRSRRIAAGLFAAAVAAGAAYAVPTQAEAAPAPSRVSAPQSGHHLSTRLVTLVAAEEAGLDANETAQALSLPATGPASLLRTPSGDVVVDVRFSSYDRRDVAAVRAAGGSILNRSPAADQVTVAALPGELTAIGDVADVEYVEEELAPMTGAVCDGTISEGDALLNANQLRATGVDGTGLKVGVISDTYNVRLSPITTASQDIASDNLPGSANTCGHTSVSTIGTQPSNATCGGNCGDEGRAMMQIVHDLAPGAALDFETAFISEPAFAASIGKLADQGANVVVDDITYFDEPMYQDGIVEQAVTAVRARGVDYFTDAANNRVVKNGHEVGSYEAVAGYRATACPAIASITTTHIDCHNFGTAATPDSTFSYTGNPGATMRAILNWAEPWAAVNTDYDIYLVDENTNAITASGASANTGGGSQKTYEIFSVAQPNTADTYGIVVARKSSTAPAGAPRFKLVFAGNGSQPFNTMQYETPVVGTDVMGPTAFGHNGGADAMSVGAASVLSSPTSLESYSSYGPVTILFGPVNGTTPAAALPTPLVLAKPDLVASDCNINTFFGNGNRFCGTSSAAPHAAAIAALLRQKYPTASFGAINSAMISTATPIAGVPGSFQGGGLVNALAARNLLRPVPDTQITKAPKRTVKTKKRKVKVSFQFTSTLAGSTFACSIDGGPFTACASGVTYKLKAGKHTFSVRATSADQATDPTPASAAFKVKRKKKHHH